MHLWLEAGCESEGGFGYYSRTGCSIGVWAGGECGVLDAIGSAIFKSEEFFSGC